MFKKILFICATFIFSVSSSFAVTVETLGEAEIVRGDIPAAKAMAVSRAKWSALEQASEVKIKLDTIINNSVLADEAVKSELSATVNKFKITDEGKDGNTYWVTIKAEIIPDKAKETLSGFSKNTSVAVILPAVLPDGETISEHALSEAIIAGLIEKGFEVTDIASIGGNITSLVEKAMKSGNYGELKELSYKYMASTLLVGSIKVFSKGNDIGYMKVNFSIMSGELNWRLIGDEDGKKSVLASGTLAGRGQGATDMDGSYDLLKNMSKNASVKVVSAVSQKILGANSKTVRVALKGETNPRIFKELRDDVKNIPFVLNVKEQGISAVFADYPEKTYYLATFLVKNGKYSIVRMDEDEIILERR